MDYRYTPDEIGELNVVIDELRAEIEQLKRDALIWQAVSSQGIGIERELRIKVERLTAALQRIADDGKNCQDYCRNQAARALEPKP